MKLINGRGQLGKALRKHAYKFSDVIIYHTWNLDDQTERTQKNEYEKFKKFVDENINETIIFISTTHEVWGEYLRYKMKAELYLLENTIYGKVIRISYLMGKGLCKRIKEGYVPFPGEIELSIIEDIAEKICDNILNTKRLIFIHGHWINASLVSELINYGKL